MRTQFDSVAPNDVILCIDSIRNGAICGRVYHASCCEAALFSSWDEALANLSALCNMPGFPRPANNGRSFFGKPRKHEAGKEWVKVMSDEELLNQHGYLDTFIVRVQHRENSTWQGRITWSDSNKTVSFRSVWEMVHLMEEAISSNAPGESIEPRHWDDEE